MTINKLVDQWLAIDINPKTREEIKKLQQEGNSTELEKRLGTRIAFGTAGLRSSMCAGFAHMNDVTVLQASQGLVAYLLADHSVESENEKSIVVGYDHRHNSQRFAELVAGAALIKGVKVYYLGAINELSAQSIQLSGTLASNSQSATEVGLVHTPLVPFSIDHYGASAGVMITASHNPAQDNGYKVYYGNGCQIIPPHDNGIAASIDTHLQPWAGVWDIVKNFEDGVRSGKLVSIGAPATAKYLEKVAGLVSDAASASNEPLRFVYTPVHGVGYDIFGKAMKLLPNVEAHVVPEQAIPDPDFPTVAFPNPEEKGALDLAIAKAEALGVALVVANDPDADRFSVAVKSPETGEWKQLTGNEIGFLFAMWTIESCKRNNDLSKVYLVNSTVSSQVLKSMADLEGFHFEDTLTGFKWIGNRAIDLKNDGYIVPFGFEEAIGYMFDVVNDKDGIAAAVVWLQLYQKWNDPLAKLTEGYNKYGWFKECNGYYKLDDLSKTANIFNGTIRALYSGHPQRIGLEFKVTYWRDLTVGYETGTPDNKPSLPTDPKSQMITGVVVPVTGSSEEYVRFTCRGSGTEPKLKVYIEAKAATSERSSELAGLCWDVLKREWFKPAENGLLEVK